MSIHKKLAKLIQTIFRQISRISRALTQKLMNWLLRGLLVISRRQGRLSRAGFALPTTIMVILVVALLTTAILVRSFNWSKNVANYRVSQEVVNAALPALDRAKKKIDALLQDQQLPRGTPTELAIDNVLKGNLPTSDKYTLADENRIQLAYDLDGDGSVRPNATSSTIENREATANAWRFFVDSDNNGKFDSVTLYSILFRTPPQGTSANEDTRQRQPLEARALPMQEGQGSQVCAAGAGTSASLVGSKGWYAIGSQIKRAFFVYVATVPISDPTRITNLPSGISAATQLEKYKGDPRRFSALEYQQDQGKTPIGNNAVFYNDDLTITAGGAFTINGRIVANSNLFVDSQTSGAPITLRQVSSQYSCYYLEENGKIVVGGNVAYGYPDVPAGDGNAVNVDLFKGPSPGGTNPAPPPATADTGSTEATLTTDNQSVDGNIFQIGFNDAAYEGRISQLVAAVLADGGTGKVATDPPEVQQTAQNLINNNKEDPRKAREDALDTYFRGRTRKVPYQEVPFQGTDNANATPDGIGTPLLAPKAPLMFPFNPADGKTPGGYAELSLKTSGNGLLPKATKFETQEKGNKLQNFTGDRVVIGNNLPQQWLQDGAWVSSDTEQIIEGTAWDSPAGAAPRQRKSRVQLLTELGNTDRDQFWEYKAQTPPPDTFASYGGLRVVTGAGIYLPPRKFPNIPTNDKGSKVVWPDTMPVMRIVRPVGSPYDNNVILSDFSATPPNPNVFGFPAAPTDASGNYRPFLQMRATAVYHYTYPQNNPDRAGKEPIACVSSFYDPTTADTARNNKKLVRPELDVSGGSDGPPTQQNGPLRPVTANSNNGITYPPPSITFSDGVVRRLLNYQADLVYPNGRPVNPALKNALRKARFGGGVNTLSLSEKASIDAALCALEIMGVGGTPPNPTTTPTAGYTLPHGTIKEVAFLDARQIKSIDSEYKPEPTGGYTGLNTLTGKYDLPIELRQPLEVRATVLDLQKLRKSATPNDPFSNAEYLLPNSGIIYATRDDALPDISDDVTTLDGRNSKPKQAAIDFHLDPTRRPNGIMLINGTPLYRDPQFRQIEKGLILASNLPVYVKADASNEFNSHKTVTPANTGTPVEEFTQPLGANASTSAFYSRQTLDPNFACRTGDTRLPSGSCPVGDQWRSATILTDSITLLSHSFREGYRSDGDYDLRNNQIDNIASPASANELKTPTGITPVIDYTAAAIEKTLQQQGFFDNNFVTSHPFTDTDYSTTTPIPIGSADKNSSYFNNFVTPIQRRGKFPELLMEWCPHLDVSQCGPNDWFVDDKFTLKATSTIGTVYRQRGPAAYAKNQAGTTVDPGLEQTRNSQQLFQLLPRRVAFARNWRGGTTRQDNLILSNTNQPVILGIDGTGKVACYTYSGTVTPSTLGDIPPTGCQPYAGGTASGPRYNPDPTKTNNALWFRTTGADGTIGTIAYDGANPPTYINPNNPPNPNIPPQFRLPSKTGIGPQKQQQPLLVPVLQIQHPTQSPTTSGATIPTGATVQFTQWLQRAPADTTFNLALATGNNPDHPADTIGTGTTAVNHEGDFNGGLANLPHFLENWYKSNPPNAQWSTIINGSFIQLKRSVYATAPFTQLPTGTTTAGPGGPFNYPVGQGYPQVYRTQNTKGKMPSYLTPGRQWGFDLGLLSQIPDLFSQQFVLPPTEQPNEFFREVDRNDTWVQALLCAKIPDPTNPDTVTSTHAINDNERPGSFCQSKTGN